MEGLSRRVREGAPGKLIDAARALFGAPATAADAAIFGLSQEEAIEWSTTKVWRANRESVRVMLSMESQWRSASGGLIGLDYGVLPFVLRMRGIPRSRWPSIFDDVTVMEGAALAEFAKRHSSAGSE